MAVLLGLVCPGESVVVELDLRGPDLAFRLTRLDGQALSRSPSIATLAVDTRPGSSTRPMDRYVQRSSLGVPVVPGLVPVPNHALAGGEGSAARARANLARQMPAIAQAVRAWPATVVADVGELRTGNPALTVAKAAGVTLLVTRATVEGLGRLWERVGELSEALGDPGRDRPPLGVVLVAEPARAKAGEQRARAVLDMVGSPVPVLGTVAFDPRSVEQLCTPGPHRKLGKSPLLRSSHQLLNRIWALWPDTPPPAGATDEPLTTALVGGAR